MNYKNLYDKETKLMRGKNENGEFMAPFSPLKWGDAFTEETAGTILGQSSMIRRD